MRSSTFFLAAALCLSTMTTAHSHRRNEHSVHAEVQADNRQSLIPAIDPAPLVTVFADNISFQTNTTAAFSIEVNAQAVVATKVNSTALVIARDLASAYSAYSGLNDHGIPYYVLTVPRGGVTLPSLNDSATLGNFGLIVVLSEVSYDYGNSGGYQSALTSKQWAALFNYQLAFGIRMVRLDAYPSSETGTKALGDCCGDGIDQSVSISNDTAFSSAGLKLGAGISTAGLWHYPAAITNPAIAIEFAQFGKATGFSSATTAGVINNINGRQQMVFFIPFSTDWNLASSFLQHAWVNWATRGLYAGQRRAILVTQVDDMFLETELYKSQSSYRIETDDLENHVTFTKKINAKLNTGSEWWIEIGHNGNGNIELVNDADEDGEVCSPGPIEYEEQVDTPLEFSKPPGSGTSLWPASADAYPNYSQECLEGDDLLNWWTTTANLNAFAHVSHTFTHEDQNNATYSDVYKEITWNQGWLAATGISKAKRFSSQGLIPPAITGLHNSDALKAWSNAGVKYAVGDNTRSVLLNPINEHWPLMTTVEENGFAGIQITPRWATRIYYNCDTPDCTVQEWIDTSAGSGTIYNLLDLEKDTSVRHLLTLHHDGFMFHQANLKYTNAPRYTINGVTARLSLFEAWVETVVQEFLRLVEWPVISLKHDDLAASFNQRMKRDLCQPNLVWDLDTNSKTITGATVTSSKMTCSEPLPVTFPGPVVDAQGFRTEQLGSDPLTIWVTLSGKPVSFKLKSAIKI